MTRHPDATAGPDRRPSRATSFSPPHSEITFSMPSRRTPGLLFSFPSPWFPSRGPPLYDLCSHSSTPLLPIEPGGIQHWSSIPGFTLS